MKKRTVYGTPVTPNRLIRQLAGSSFCVSYWNRKRLGSQLDEIIEITGADEILLVDNGAFSAWNKSGAEPFLDDDYTEQFEAWALEILDRCPQAVAVIPDTITGTLDENVRLLNETQLPHGRAMPCYHMHEPLDYLEHLIAGGWSYIAIGSSGEFAKTGTPAWRARMDEIFATFDRFCTPEAGYVRPWIHMMRAQAFGDRYDFDSTDSTSVAVNHHRYKAQGGDYVRAYADRIRAKIDASCSGAEDVDRLDGPFGGCSPADRGIDWHSAILVKWQIIEGAELALRRLQIMAQAEAVGRGDELSRWLCADAPEEDEPGRADT